MRVPTAAIALALLAGCGTSAPTGDNPSPAPAPSRYGAATPVGLAVADGRVWTVESGGGAVSARAEPGDAAVRVHVGDTPLRAAYDGHLLWVSVFGAGRVVAIDPTVDKVVMRVRVPGQPEGIVAAFGSIWVVRQQDRLLTRITPTGNVRQGFHLGREPRLVTANDTALFVSDFGGDTVTRIDPRAGTVRTSRQICFGPQGLAASNHVLWVTCTTEGKVLALDPETLRVKGQVRIADEPDAIRLADGRLLVVRTNGPDVVELTTDPVHPAVVGVTPLGHAAQLFDQANVDLVIADGSWWVSSPGENQVIVYPR